MSDEPRIIRLIMELRQEGIADTDVLSAIERTPRELFVQPAFADRAYDNTALPIEEGQTISQPYVVAFMSEALKLNDRVRVLEIGTGSGYQAAVLARLSRRVYTVERYRSLLKAAEERFATLGIHIVTTRFGDGGKGWPEQAPFDRIIVTAAALEVPQILAEQLAVDGIMVLPLGQRGWSQQLVRVTPAQRWIRRGRAVAGPLRAAARRRRGERCEHVPASGRSGGPRWPAADVAGTGEADARRDHPARSPRRGGSAGCRTGPRRMHAIGTGTGRVQGVAAVLRGTHTRPVQRRRADGHRPPWRVAL